MPNRPPALAFVLGFAGLLPFVACGLGAGTSSDALQADRFVAGLIAYGAVILAFLGGVHWGFVLSPVPGDREVAAGRTRARLILGVTPSLVGFASLLLLIVLGLANLALAVLLAGFVALTAAEAGLNRRGLLPPGYMLLRWMLSAAVGLILAAVLVVRLLGAHIIF